LAGCGNGTPGIGCFGISFQNLEVIVGAWFIGLDLCWVDSIRRGTTCTTSTAFRPLPSKSSDGRYRKTKAK
jgi:hypothetical protein